MALQGFRGRCSLQSQKRNARVNDKPVLSQQPEWEHFLDSSYSLLTKKQGNLGDFHSSDSYMSIIPCDTSLDPSATLKKIDIIRKIENLQQWNFIPIYTFHFYLALYKSLSWEYKMLNLALVHLLRCLVRNVTLLAGDKAMHCYAMEVVLLCALVSSFRVFFKV